MDRKILMIAGVLFGLAALSPAPINDARVKRAPVAPQSQEQLAKQQQFNGVVPEVGQVPAYVNEIGEEAPRHHIMQASTESAESINVASAKADKVGGAISAASNRVEVESKSSGHSSWWLGLLLATVGFAGWKGVQYKLEKSVPVPDLSKRFPKES